MMMKEEEEKEEEKNGFFLLVSFPSIRTSTVPCLTFIMFIYHLLEKRELIVAFHIEAHTVVLEMELTNTNTNEEGDPVVDPEHVQTQRLVGSVSSSLEELKKTSMAKDSSEAFAAYGSIFGVLFCIVIAVAGKIHWGDEAQLCLVPAEVPFQDYTTPLINYSDYPNPRCASLTKNGGRFDEDQGATWYFWMLPESQRDLLASQTTAWILYAAHQLSVWATIFVAQKEYNSNGGFLAEGINKEQGPKYTKGIRRINKIAMGTNLLFWVLHLLHTHIWYDALAPSVHEMSSQGSVILMLVIVLMMEGPKRGLFVGNPGYVWSLEAVEVAKRYHGYVFSWAVIYTFWYHPMESYLGHLFGFFHVFIVMLQGSLIYTTAHVNRYWRMVCEAWVFLHGMVISMQTLSSNSWPMFTFGFGAIFALTQLPGLPCLQNKHLLVRCIPAIIYAIVYVSVYVSVVQWTKPYVIVFIPMAEYLGAIFLNVAMYGLIRCMRATSLWKKRSQTAGLAVVLSFTVITIIFSIMAQVLDRSGGNGALVVYIPMCTLMPLIMFGVRLAIPFEKEKLQKGNIIDPGIEDNPPRIPSTGWTKCCERL